MNSLTVLFGRLREGDRAALDLLIEEVYPELRQLAHNQLAGERKSHTLSTVNLVHEAFVRFSSQGALEFRDRAHFFAVAARVMRNILVDYARARRAAKRGGGLPGESELTLSAPEADIVTVLDLDRVLTQLEAEDEALSQMIEMRFFGGMTAEEIADANGRSVHAVRHDLRFAQAWLRRAADGLRS